MKKLVCWLTLLCLLLAAVPAAPAEGGDDGHTVAGKTVDFYYFDAGTIIPHDVYFIDGADVPYLALSDWQDILNGPVDDPDKVMLTPGQGEVIEFAFSMEGNTGVLTREDGYFAAFDCDADVIRFLDFDAFLKAQRNDLLTEMVTGGVPAPGEPVRYFKRSKYSYERYGREVTIDAAGYGVDLVAEGGECYVPMQTLSDLLMCNYSICIFWNGEIAVVGMSDDFGEPDALTPLGEIYYSVTPRARSEAMARFTYGELCLVLNTMYGLKANHDIGRFEDMIDDTGLKAELTGTDAVRANAALYQLLNVHLDDLHTGFILPSPLAGVNSSQSFNEEGFGLSDLGNYKQYLRYRKAREAVWPEGVPTYEEVGNTAFITFDGFRQVPDGVDYYKAPPTAEARDTVGIMIYAYRQITRENSPIENVVLDLSCNSGGSADAAVFTMAAFLGTGSLSTKNVLSGAMVTGNYAIDINLDGVADDGDKGLLDKNRFCIESPVSFSCANLVTCAFKASDEVSLLGRASGGGACFVQTLSTADGACCQLSSAVQMSFLKNGSFYDIDRGAEPDIPLLKIKSFYDRQALVAFINSTL